MAVEPRTVNVSLTYSPRPWQKECHEKFKQFNVLAVHRQAGKALDVDTMIPMADGGFTRMGDLRDNDRVLDESGSPCRVFAVHPVQYGKRCLRVTFSDGTEVVCDQDHLWHTQTKLDRAHRDGRSVLGQHVSGTLRRLPGSKKTAAEIEKSLLYCGENNHSVMLAGPAQYEAKPQTVPPYILGLWLGDGTSAASAYTTMDPWIHDAFCLYAESKNYTVRPKNSQSSGLATTYQVSSEPRGRGQLDSLQRDLRLLGVLGRGRKNIPANYLYGSYDQRIALLAGLMDTDGFISAGGRKCEITLVCKQLVADLMILLCGLGLKPSVNTKWVKGREYQRIIFTPLFNPFRLERKAARYRETGGSNYSNNRHIVSVVEVPTRPVRCISVDSPNHLYLCTEKYVPTHNTTLAMNLLIVAASQSTLPLPRFGYIAPELRQAKSVMWDRLKAQVEPLRLAGAVEVSEGETLIRFTTNNAIIRLYGAKDPDSLRGMYFDGVVLDEVAQMEAVVWHEIIYPMLMHRNGWVLFIGTPKGINFFSAIYFGHEKDPEWFVRRWTCYETNALEADKIAKYKDESSPQTFAREMLCDFNAQADDQIIPLSLAVEASQRSIAYMNSVVRSSPIVLGIDPARFGDDRSTIVRRQGLCMFDPIVLRGVDNMELAARVAAEIREHKPQGVFVDAGAGAGVIDRLRQLGHSVVEVPFGGRAVKEKEFANRRTEIWWGIRKWLESGGVIPKNPELVRELSTPTWWFDNRDKRVMESKDTIKKRLPSDHGSPDIADALALTFASDVGPLRREDEWLYPQKRRVREHDPLAKGWRDR